MRSIEIRAFGIEDYEAVFALWRQSEGVGLTPSDEREPIRQFLLRHAGLSFVAEDGTEIVGAVLCSEDGRRGYLHHLAVRPSHRRRGVARTLVQQCLAALNAHGIPKCNVFLYADNEAGKTFWLREGWKARSDLVVLQRLTDRATV